MWSEIFLTSGGFAKKFPEISFLLKCLGLESCPKISEIGGIPSVFLWQTLDQACKNPHSFYIPEPAVMAMSAASPPCHLTMSWIPSHPVQKMSQLASPSPLFKQDDPGFLATGCYWLCCPQEFDPKGFGIPKFQLVWLSSSSVLPHDSPDPTSLSKPYGLLMERAPTGSLNFFWFFWSASNKHLKMYLIMQC